MKFFAYDINEDLRLKLEFLLSGRIIDRSNGTIEVHLNEKDYDYFLSYMAHYEKEVIAVL
jgi:hypothetical protein